MNGMILSHNLRSVTIFCFEAGTTFACQQTSVNRLIRNMDAADFSDDEYMQTIDF